MRKFLGSKIHSGSDVVPKTPLYVPCVPTIWRFLILLFELFFFWKEDCNGEKFAKKEEKFPQLILCLRFRNGFCSNSLKYGVENA